MNKIITLSVFLLLASNIFAMHSHNFNNKPVRFIAQKVSLLSTTKKPIAKPAPIVANKPNIKHTSTMQDPQVLLQPIKSVNFLELLDETMLDQDGAAKIGQLSQSSITARKSSSFIAKGCEVDVSALFYEVTDLTAAIKDNDLEKISKYLLQDDSIFDERTYEDGCSILMFAIKYSNVDTVMFLLQHHKFCLEETDINGRTALMYAASSKTMLRVVVELLNKGVDVNREDYEKHNALMYAAGRVANIDIAIALLDKAADCCKVSKDGLSVLDFAVLGKNTKIIINLLLRNIDKLQIEKALKLIIKEFNKFDHTQFNKNVEIIDVLLSYGVSKLQDKNTLIKNVLDLIVIEYKEINKKIKRLDEVICKLEEKILWLNEMDYELEEEIKVPNKEREELDCRKKAYEYIYEVFSAYLDK